MQNFCKKKGGKTGRVHEGSIPVSCCLLGCGVKRERGLNTEMFFFYVNSRPSSVTLARNFVGWRRKREDYFRDTIF